MGTNLRRLGVFGKSLPTKKSKVVRAADFNIGGIVGLFERRYKVPLICNNITEFQQKFGDHGVSTYYGWDAVKGFFDNVPGVSAKLYVLGHVGYAASAYDGVAATVSLSDGANPTLKLESAYEGELDYSLSGNRTGYTVTLGSRFTTAIKTASLLSDTFVICDSVAGMVVGDVLQVNATGVAPVTVYKEITQIDESTGKVHFTGAFHGASNPEIADVVTIPGFQLKIFRQSLTGVVNEVEEGLGKVWCTMQDTVSDYFVENVFSSSKWVKGTDLDSASAIGSQMPSAVATVTYLASGANGTAPTTAAHWSADLLAFDDLPVRFLANPETTDVDIQKAIETYARTRWDNPKVLINVAEDQTKSQLTTIGNNFQRSDDVLEVLVGDWYEVTDPFASSAIAPNRNVPSVGHTMGMWIRSIATLGIHFVPAVAEIPVFGIKDIVRKTIFGDEDRTDLAEAGMNIAQFVEGSGILVRNFFTPSTSEEFQFANGPLMRDFIKVSAVDSLQKSENTPNSFNRIKEDKMAVLNFYLRLWQKGSTGSVVEGETFGQSLTASGDPTVWSDHIEVQADIVNNPQSNINAGERNVDSWFTYPTPAGSIQIGVGILLRS